MNTILASYLAFGAWAAAVAFYDCRSRRVPNLLVAVGLFAAWAAGWLHAGPMRIGLAHSLAAAMVGLVALLPFFLVGIMGAADVKVFAVLGAWCGVHALVGLWVVASLAAGAHAIALLIAQRTRANGDVRVVAAGPKRGTPYAACLTVPAIAWLALQFVAGGVR